MITQTFDIDLSEMNECNVSFFRGDKFRLTINVKNAGIAFDMSGYTPILTAKLSPTGVAPVIQLKDLDINMTNADTGRLVFTFKPSDTENLAAGKYYYDIQITSGDDNYTIIKGRLVLMQDVTTNPVPKYYYYIGKILQVEDSHPSVNIIKNEIGTVSFRRVEEGKYLMEIEGLMVSGKATALVSKNRDFNGDYCIETVVDSPGLIRINTYFNKEASDNCLDTDDIVVIIEV